jgi:hypothetical protein
MKQQPVRYRYFATLWDSLVLVTKNPKVMIPFIITSLLSLLTIPFAVKFQNPTYILGNLSILLIYSLVAILFGTFVYGWTFSLINQLLIYKKIKFGKSIPKAFSFGIRFVVIMVIAVLIIFLAYFALLGILYLASYLGAIFLALIALILISAFLVLLLFYSTALMQILPVLIVEDKGISETVRITLRFYLKKKLFSLNMSLVSALAYLILLIPYYIYVVSIIILGSFSTTIVYTTQQMLIMNLLTIIPNLFFVVLAVYYSKSYILKKEKIKEKKTK